MTLEVRDVTDFLLAQRLVAGVRLHLETLCAEQKKQLINPEPPKALRIMGRGWREVAPEQDPRPQSDSVLLLP